MIKPVIEFIEFRVLHINDSPERIAGGVFYGILIAYTPFLGLHILIGLLAASAFKVNKFATVSFVWISNVFTLIPVYYPAYIVGNKILNFFTHSPAASKKEIIISLKNLVEELSVTNILMREFWRDLFNLCGRLGLELIIGGFVIGLPLAFFGYYLTLKLLRRNKRRLKRLKIQKLKTKAVETV